MVTNTAKHEYWRNEIKFEFIFYRKLSGNENERESKLFGYSLFGVFSRISLMVSRRAVHTSVDAPNHALKNLLFSSVGGSTKFSHSRLSRLLTFSMLSEFRLRFRYQ